MTRSRQLKIEILADDKTGATFAVVDDKASKLGAKLGKAFAVGGLLAAGALAKFGKDSVSAFRESEEAQKRLDDAFAKFPQLAGANAEGLRKINEQLAQKTKYDDDATASGQAVLAGFKLTESQIATLTPLMQDYAARTGKDLPSAAQDLGKAVLGQGKALKAIGLNFKGTGSEAKNFDQLVGGLRDQVGGFAANEGETTSGKLAILGNRFGEVKETVGAKLVPMLTILAEKVLGLIGFIERNAQVIGPLVAIVGGLAAVVWIVSTALGAATAIAGAFGVTLNLALGPIALVVVALVALGVGLVVLYRKCETFRNIVNAVFSKVAAIVAATVGFIKAHWQTLLAILTGPIGLAVLVISKNWDRIKGGVTALKNAVGATFSAIWGGIKTGVNGAKDWVVGKFNAIVTFVTGMPAKVAKAAKGMFDGIVDAFKGAINILIGAWNSIDFGISIKVPGWVPGVGGKGFEIKDIFPDIPMLAKGGTATSGGMALVGERGPELLAMPTGASVIPLNGRKAVGGGGVTIVVHASGNVTRSEDELGRRIATHVRDELLREKRRGLAIGLA